MEDNSQSSVENQINQSENQSVSTPEVGFPVPQNRVKKSGGRWIFLVLGLVLLIGGIIFLVSRNKQMNGDNATPTPFAEEELQTPPAVEEGFTPAPSPVVKEEVTIVVQNGTGVAGEASYLQGILKSMGYTETTAENADETDAEATTVTFKSTLDQTVVSEILAKLKEIYQDVNDETSTSATDDVVIITGLKKGSISSPTASPSAEPEE